MTKVATAPTVYGIETPTEFNKPNTKNFFVATAPTVYGIETVLAQNLVLNSSLKLQQHLPFTVLKHVRLSMFWSVILRWLQQHLPFTVCAEGCETAEEQSDDEVRTSQVPEQSEGKTKVI